MDSTATFYSQPSYVSSGGAFPVFAGGRRQRGGGIFGSLARMVLPALKSVGKSVLKSAGQQALGLATEVAQSALSGEGLSGVKQTLQRQGLKRLANVGRTTLKSVTDEFQTPAASAAVGSVAGSRRVLRKRRRNTSASTANIKRVRRGAGALNF